MGSALVVAVLMAACAARPGGGPSAASDSAVPARPDAQMQAVLDQLAALGGEPIVELAPAAARRQPTLPDAVRALLEAQGRSTAPEVVGRVEDHLMPGAVAGAALPVRLYWPAGPGPHPLLVYFHDGGFVLGHLALGDAPARALTRAAGAIVVAVQYRQGPGHRFPAAHEDAWAAYRWTLAHAEAFGGDAARVAVGGEGAGGNLAAHVSLRARDEGVPMPVHQLLVHPITDVSLDTPSHRQHVDARPLGTAQLPWFFSHYLRSPIEGADPAFSMLRAADLSRLPPATVITADIDPLRSQGHAYAERMSSAGVAVDYRNVEGVTHGFLGTAAVVDRARDAVAHAAARLRQAFAMR